MIRILIDADMVLFRACSVCETEITWKEDFSTLHCDHNEVKAIVDDQVAELASKVLRHYKYAGNFEIIMAFSDKENFRKKLLPTYKANRVGKRKPLGYTGVKAWIEKEFNTVTMPGLEADDVIGILATNGESDVITVSGDKDFKTIPGKFYNLISGEFTESSLEDADRWHLYQTLVGDTADNYKGCPGVGEITAKKVLDADPTWEAVVELFKKKKLTEKDALLQARIAHILRHEDWDEVNQKPILWVPKS